jgi:glucokinase
MATSKKYLGIDIGGTTFKSGVIDLENNIIFSNKIPSNPASTAEEALNRMSSLIDEAISLHPEICSIGIGLPGIITKNGIWEFTPNLPNWRNIPILDFFQSKYKNISVAVDNDANAAAIAEMEAGQGKNLNNFIYLTLGTGVGGAIIIDKKIYKGVHGGAGEIGHIIVEPTHFKEDLPAFRNGILEELIGRKQIIETALKIKNDYAAATNETINPADFALFDKEFDVLDISNAADSGNIIAIKCLSLVGIYLGFAIASTINILDITDFIIGGGISQSKIVINEATKTAQMRAFPPTAQHLNITPAKFLYNTGIIGAALLGKNNC